MQIIAESRSADAATSLESFEKSLDLQFLQSQQGSLSDLRPHEGGITSDSPTTYSQMVEIETTIQMTVCQGMRTSHVAPPRLVQSPQTRTSALRLISRLPSELLSSIFRASALVEPPTSSSLGWIKVTHVYSRWRQVACSDQTLWSTVSDELGEEWTKEMLQRAQSSLLTLRMSSSSWSASSILSLLDAHIHHIQNLDLSFSLDTMDKLLRAFPVDVYHLQDLRLDRRPLEEDDFDLYDPISHLPEVFSNHAKALRKLSLSLVRIDFSEQMSQHLEHVDLIAPPYDPIHHSQLATLLLQSSTSLRYLRLSECCSSIGDPPSFPDAVFLPNLQELHVIDRFPEHCPMLAVFIAALHTPTLHRLVINCVTYPDEPDYRLSSLVNSLPGLFQRTAAFPRVKVFRVVATASELRTSANVALIGWSTAQTETSNPDLNISVANTVATFGDIRRILQALSLQDVSVLSIDIDGILNDWVWTDLIIAFPSVTHFQQTVQVENGRTWLHFLGAFTPVPFKQSDLAQTSQSNTVPSSLPIFPRLHQLVIHVDATDEQSKELYFSDLHETLLRRRRFGFGVEELRVKMDASFAMTPQHDITITRLQSVVPNTVSE